MDNEDKLKSLYEKYKWFLGIGVAIIVAPSIYFILKGVVGLIATVVLGLTAVHLAPVLALKLANWRMKLLVDEIETNPIETLQNLIVEKSSILDKSNNQIKEFNTEILNYDSKLVKFSKQFPSEAKKFNDISKKMHDSLEVLMDRQNDALKDLENTKMQIEKAKSILAMAMAAQKLTDISGQSERQIYEDIKKEIAFDSIQNQLNKSFTNLDMALDYRKKDFNDQDLLTIDNQLTKIELKDK